MSAGPRPTFRGDIEGLRAIAVLLVLVYHVGISALSGGFIGVDVFFVISGFLITSHLLKEIEATGTVRLVHFYARRARRLLPAATIVLLFTAAAGFLVLPRVHLANMASDVATAAVYIVNWALAWRSVDYLAESTAVSPVQHYWSLSVEEQFYLAWPLLMLVALFVTRKRLAPRVPITAAVLLVSVVSLAWSVHYTAVNPQMAFFVTTTRAWELGAGALLALALPAVRRLPRALSEVLALAGLVLVGAAAFWVDTTTLWPGAAALLPVVGTVLILLAGCAHVDTVAGRLLSIPPMQWIGGLSYSIYLWHWPLLVYASHLWPDLGLGTAVAIGAASIPLAWLTRRYVEDPIRFGPRLRAPRRAFAIGGAGMALSLAAAAAVYATIDQQPTAQVDAPGALALVADRDATGVPPQVADPSAVVTSSGPIAPAPEAAEDDLPAYYLDGCNAQRTDSVPFVDCVYGNPDADTTVALVGDSKLGQWLPALELIALQEDWRLEFYVKSACSYYAGLQYPQCNEWNARLQDHLLTRTDPVELVVTTQGQSTLEPEFAPREPSEEVVDAMVEYWLPLQERGTRIVALADNPGPSFSELPDNPESVFECVAEHPDDYSVCSFTANQGHGTAAVREAAERAGVDFVDLNPWICPAEEQCPPVIGEVLVLRQGSHLTATYTESLAPVLHRTMIEFGVATAPPLPLEITELSAAPSVGGRLTAADAKE